MNFLKRLFGGRPRPDAVNPVPFGLSGREDGKVVMFLNHLCVMLPALEEAKGAPLTEQEVLDYRDGAVCALVSPEARYRIWASIGFADFDHENLWEEWQAYRRDCLGKTDIAPADQAG